MGVTIHNTAGQAVGHIELSEDVFGVPPNQAVVHQALVSQLANRRQGTANTKTRGQVAGSTRKFFRQKHTGRARRGSIRSPVLRGGGVAFGPHPRSYRKQMPKKVRRLALRCVLSAKVAEGELIVVDRFNLERPKTKDMVGILAALGVNSSALIATPEPDVNVIKSSRNLRGIKTMPAALLNVVDLLSCKLLIITVAGVHKVEQLWGQKELVEVS